MIKLARLMPGAPQYFEPLRLAENQESLAGELELGDMPRLGEVVANGSGAAGFELDFNRSDDGAVFITGKFHAAVQLICQRCLQPFEYLAKGTVGVAVIADRSQEAGLPDDLEPLILKGHKVHLRSFIEDEILLGLPMVALHDTEVCPVRIPDVGPPAGRARPFDVLKDLKVK